MHSHVICICTRVAAATEEAVYEVVAEPQEPQGQPRSRRFVGSRPKAHLTLELSRRLKASPGAQPINLNYDTYIYVYYLCITYRNWLKP